MITVYAKADCGCCTIGMKFKNDESVKAAFAAAGLTNGAEITDDDGVRHEGIDTFYGFSTEEGEQEDKSLAFLAKAAGFVG